VSKLPGRITCGRTRDLLERAAEQGFDIRRRPGKSNHFAVYGPDGAFVNGVSGTTGDRRSHLQLRSALRRAGYRGV
jgi:hypothetical protein